MKLTRIILPAMLSFALGATVLPAAAQQRGGQHERATNGGQRATPREQGRQREGTPEARQPEQRQAQPREGQGAQPQPNEQARPRERGGQRAEPREVRPAGPDRANSARGIYDNRRDEDRDRGRERERHGSIAPRVAPYRPYYYARPYYSFRPRYDLGFGIWLGYPVPYPDYGYDAYSYPDPYDAPPPPPDAIDVQPGEAYGGLSFAITPDTAAIYIDGEYAGQAADFTPNAQPLTIGAGDHHVEVDAPGYRPMMFDIDVEPGQVVPFQGEMQPD